MKAWCLPRVGTIESLSLETILESPPGPDEAVLEVELYDALGIGAFLCHGGPEGDSTQRRRGPPVLQLLGAPATADAEVVERLGPTGQLKSRVGGVETEQRGASDLTRLRGVKRQANPAERGADDVAHFLRIDPDPLARALQRCTQIIKFLRLAGPPGGGLIVHLGKRGTDPLGVVYAGHLAGELGRTHDSFLLKAIRQFVGDDLADRTQLLADQLGLSDKRLEDDILLALLKEEVAAPDRR